MKRIAGSLFTLIFALGTASAFDGNTIVSSPAPSYNPKTELEVSGQIAGVREASSGVLRGTFLTVKTRTATVEVYLGPTDFIKMFGVELRNGDDVTAVGSKVKVENKEIVLGRDLEVGKVKLTLRDEKGDPNWLWMNKTEIPTGF